MSSELETRLSDGIASLPGKYASLGGAIDAMRQPVANVLITEYPDMTRAKDGEFPDWWVATTCSAGLIKPQEWEFLHDHLLVPLNDAVESASFEHGWEYVDGMKEAFRHHGYCASPGLFDGTGESYIVKIFESLRLLGEENGTAHADLDGQRVYRDALVETINRLMTPATTASTGAVGRSIEVSLEAYNRLPTSGVKRTYYAVDRPDCGPESLADCVEYSGPFRIDDAGDHQLTYFSENLHGSLEKPNTVRIVIEAP